MVPKLEQGASANDPASMQLMHIARDDLPQMLRDSREQPSATEQKVDHHFQHLDRILASHADQTVTFHWTISGIVVFDLVLVVTGLWWWKRSS